MRKYHVRRDENGAWVEENGLPIPDGARLVYHYGKRPIGDTGRVVGTIRQNCPNVSRNAAVHVDQVASMNEQCVKGTHYDPRNGNLVSTSYAAREREARRRGMSFG